MLFDREAASEAGSFNDPPSTDGSRPHYPYLSRRACIAVRHVWRYTHTPHDGPNRLLKTAKSYWRNALKPMLIRSRAQGTLQSGIMGGRRRRDFWRFRSFQ